MSADDTPTSLVAWVDLGLGVATISLFLYLMVSPRVTGRRLDVSCSYHRCHGLGQGTETPLFRSLAGGTSPMNLSLSYP